MAEISSQGGENKPVIVSEIGAGAIYGNHDPFGQTKWSEERQCRILQDQIEGVLGLTSAEIRPGLPFPISKPSRLNRVCFFHIFGSGLPGKVADLVATRILTSFPKLDPSVCVGCGKCAEICPAKAMKLRDSKPKINRGACIHCLCCQEFCPKGAIQVSRHAIMRLFGK